MTALDLDVRARLDAGDVDGATTTILRAIGPEVLGFLVAITHDVARASDAFSELSIDLWRGLRGFQGRANVRTWVYTLARHAAYRVLRTPRVAAAAVPLSQSPVAEQVAAEVRDSTVPYLRTEVKDGFAALRAQLDPDDQVLLVLRVDRGMEWREIAEVLAPERDATRESAALRKRFERVKARLRALADAAGLTAR